MRVRHLEIVLNATTNPQSKHTPPQFQHSIILFKPSPSNPRSDQVSIFAFATPRDKSKQNLKKELVQVVFQFLHPVDSSTMPTDDDASTGVKREHDSSDEPSSPNKKVKSEPESTTSATAEDGSDKDGSQAFVQPGTVGVTTINDNDVLSG